MDEEPLPLATYATVLAHLVCHRGQPIEKVLGALGVTLEQLEKADAHYNERLRESHRLRKGILAMSFAAAFAEARKGQGLFTQGASPHFGPPAAPESSALPSYMTASPPVAAAPPAWQTPAPTHAPAPAVAPPPMVAPAPVQAAAPAAPHPANVTAPSASSGVGTGTQLPPTDAPRLPDTPWDQVASRVGKLTLAHYAALTIELSRNPADLTPLLQRYGLSSQDDLRHVNAAFQAQMSFDPTLRAQFDALIGRMRSMSTKRD